MRKEEGKGRKDVIIISKKKDGDMVEDCLAGAARKNIFRGVKFKSRARELNG